jgi:hypothetical protein
MALYRMDVLERPDERLRRRREFHALDDQAAVKRADELYAEFAAGVSLDRYVLYESDRVVHEHVEPR